jgi:hypothetical protein
VESCIDWDQLAVLILAMGLDLHRWNISPRVSLTFPQLSDDRGHVRVSACNERASSREIEKERGVWVFQARALSVGLEDLNETHYDVLPEVWATCLGGSD